MIVGAVGSLQIDVMRERIPAYQIARWIASDDEAVIKAFVDKNVMTTGTDVDGAPVFLAKSAWDVGYAQEKNPDLRFLTSQVSSCLRLLWPL